MNPLLHYLRHGDHEGRRPIMALRSRLVSRGLRPAAGRGRAGAFPDAAHVGRFAPMPELYAVLHLPPYRDDPASGEDPFAHYLDDMLQRTREAFPDLAVR